MVLILDCCFAGLACEESAARRAHLLMAVGPDVMATHDPSGTGPTHFTGALVELMREGDPEAGPWIDLETAYRWLEPRLVTRYGKDRQPYQQPIGAERRDRARPERSMATRLADDRSRLSRIIPNGRG